MAGKDVPDELRELPGGTYVVEAVDGAPSLTTDEEQGLAQALASSRADKGRAVEDVRKTIDAILGR